MKYGDINHLIVMSKYLEDNKNVSLITVVDKKGNIIAFFSADGKIVSVENVVRLVNLYKSSCNEITQLCGIDGDISATIRTTSGDVIIRQIDQHRHIIVQRDQTTRESGRSLNIERLCQELALIK